MMEDYYIFLAERGVNTAGKYREDYWNDKWDSYWTEYCTAFNQYVRDSLSVDEEVHYFRNNLNRIPETLEDVLLQYDDWVLMNRDMSLYHMLSTDFSGPGTYNLKFISKNGMHEGVYINKYGSDYSLAKGEACTEKTDAKNMGTYNYQGMYYDNIFLVLEHAALDVVPYNQYGNVSTYDLPTKEEIEYSYNLYDNHTDAINARMRFRREWKGVKMR